MQPKFSGPPGGQVATSRVAFHLPSFRGEDLVTRTLREVRLEGMPAVERALLPAAREATELPKDARERCLDASAGNPGLASLLLRLARDLQASARPRSPASARTFKGGPGGGCWQRACQGAARDGKRKTDATSTLGPSSSASRSSSSKPVAGTATATRRSPSTRAVAVPSASTVAPARGADASGPPVSAGTSKVAGSKLMRHVRDWRVAGLTKSPQTWASAWRATVNPSRVNRQPFVALTRVA